MGSLVDILISVAESSRESVRDGEKSELSELNPVSLGGWNQDWHAAYQRHVAEYRPRYQEMMARRWAWERVAAAWHRANAPQIGPEVCAACGVFLVEGGNIIDLIPQRIRVHAGEDYECLVEYGRRWRKEAAAAMGIPEPADGGAAGGTA